MNINQVMKVKNLISKNEPPEDKNRLQVNNRINLRSCSFQVNQRRIYKKITIEEKLVIVNDLNRACVHWLGAWLLGHLLTRNALTRHDAPLSVRRAYTPREMARLLRDAGLEPRAIQRAFLGHRYALSAVPVDWRPGAHGRA